MTQSIIVDTGPLVAWLDAQDQWHTRAVDLSHTLQPPFFTCEAVLTEACFLLQAYPNAIKQIGDWAKCGWLRATTQLESNSQSIFKLMSKYRDLPMSLADACLVAMSDAHPGARIFTFDQHFALYRTPSRRKLRTIGLEE